MTHALLHARLTSPSLLFSTLQNPRRGGGLGAEQRLGMLMQHLERHYKTGTVLLCGYKDELDDLLGTNEGFGSRFPMAGRFHFEDFTELELRAIFRSYVADRGLTLPSRAECGVSLAAVVAMRLARRRGTKGFGNARDMRNKVDEAVKQWERRTAAALREAKRTSKPMTSRTFFRLSREDVLGAKPDPLSSPHMAKLEAEIIGQAAVKARIRRLAAKVLEDAELEEAGGKPSGIPLHSVFIGPPGTGKTTIAKIYASLLAEWGLLSKGDVLIRTAKDLTTMGDKGVADLMNAAKGNVLFVDEAYNLDAQQGATGNAKGAIDTLFEKMPIGDSADCAIILAG